MNSSESIAELPSDGDVNVNSNNTSDSSDNESEASNNIDTTDSSNSNADNITNAANATNPNITAYSSDTSDSDNEGSNKSKSKIPPLTFDAESILQAHKKLQRSLQQHVTVLQQRLQRYIQNSTQQSNTTQTQKYTNELNTLNSIDLNELVQYAWQIYYTAQHTDDKTLPTLSTNKSIQQLQHRILQASVVQRCIHSIIRDRERYLLRQYKLSKALKRKRHNENKHKRKLEQLKSNGITVTAAALKPVSKQLTDAQKAFNLLKVGLTVDGVVEGINSDIGAIFIDFWYKRNKYRGMLHISQLSDNYVKNDEIDTVISVGDAVRAAIYTIDNVKMRVNLSLKSANFPADKQPIIERLSQTVKRDTADDNIQNTIEHVDSSAFITSLKSNIKRSLPEDKIHKLMSISKGRNNSGNRLGQRERRKLIMDVYGENAKFLMEKKVDKSLLPERSYKKSKHNNIEAEPVVEPVIRYAQSQHPTEQEQNSAATDNSSETKLHPSWAAKKQTQGIVQPQGKKVKLS